MSLPKVARRLKEPAEMREGGTAIDGAVCGGAAMEDAGQTRMLRW